MKITVSCRPRNVLTLCIVGGVCLVLGFCAGVRLADRAKTLWRPGTDPATANRLFAVTEGDSLQSIAQAYGIRVEALMAANPGVLSNADLKPYRILRIPAGGTRTPGPTGTDARTYVVASGDTLTAIAQAFAISADDLRRANPEIPLDGGLVPGTPIKIPIMATPPPDTAAGPGIKALEHTVMAGDTLEDIALMYGTTVDIIRRANPGVFSSADLTPRMVLKIPFE